MNSIPKNVAIKSKGPHQAILEKELNYKKQNK